MIGSEQGLFAARKAVRQSLMHGITLTVVRPAYSAVTKKWYARENGFVTPGLASILQHGDSRTNTPVRDRLFHV